jgi:cytochrome c5
MTFKFSLTFRLAGVLTAAVLSACVAPIIEPDAKDARWAATRWPGTSLDDLKGGRRLFVARCASCHELPVPNVKTPDEWASVIDEMAPRAHLTPGDRDQVLRYLSAASERVRKGG